VILHYISIQSSSNQVVDNKIMQPRGIPKKVVRLLSSLVGLLGYVFFPDIDLLILL